MRKIEKIMITNGDIKMPSPATDRIHRQKISKDISHLNNNINHLNLINLHRPLHATTAVYTFFSSIKKMFTKIDHMPGHKIIHNFKRLISPRIFSLIKTDFN